MSDEKKAMDPVCAEAPEEELDLHYMQLGPRQRTPEALHCPFCGGAR